MRKFIIAIFLLLFAGDAIAQNVQSPSGPSETFGTQLRRLAQRAAINNQLLNTPLIGSTPWKATTSFSPGNQVSNGGSVYQETAASCTSAGSGGPSGFGAAITDNTCTWAYIGQQTAPAITPSTVDPNLPGGFRLFNTSTCNAGTGIGITASGLDPRITVYGSVPYCDGSDIRPFTASTGINQSGNQLNGTVSTTGYGNGGTAAICFRTDAQTLVLQELQFSQGGLFVDTGNGWQLVTNALTSPGGGGNSNFEKLDWTNTATPRQMRTYKFTYGAAFGVTWLELGSAGDTVLACPSAIISSVAYGDSISNGNNTTFGWHDYCNVVAELLGWENSTCSGNGGEGYAQGNAGTPGQSGGGLQARLTAPYLELTMFNAMTAFPTTNVIIVAEGVNDDPTQLATVTSKVTATLQLLRSTYPNALIITLGPFYQTPGQTLLQQQQKEAAIFSGWQAGDNRGGTLGCFVPIIVPTAPGSSNLSWINANNSGTYISSSPHPNDLGHLFYGAMLAAAIRQSCLPQVP